MTDLLQILPNQRMMFIAKVKDNGDGYMEYAQIIKVIDNQRPTYHRVRPKRMILCASMPDTDRV